VEGNGEGELQTRQKEGAHRGSIIKEKNQVRNRLRIFTYSPQNGFPGAVSPSPEEIVLRARPNL
jgi:hypothetical protein